MGWLFAVVALLAVLSVVLIVYAVIRGTTGLTDINRAFADEHRRRTARRAAPPQAPGDGPS